MATGNKSNAEKDGIINNNRPSSPEGSEGQKEDVVLGIDISYGPESSRKHWLCGLRIHTGLYCKKYEREIFHYDKHCPSYSSTKPMGRTVRPSKSNGYQERQDCHISCSTCHHSINTGLRFKKI